jgi:hypothetical protein
VNRRIAAGLAATVALLAAVGCSDDEPSAAPAEDPPAEDSPAEATGPIVLSTEGNNLNAYGTAPPFDKQTVIRTAADDPDGLDINGQLCFFPDDPHLLITGEDTGQPERTPGWAIFEVDGDQVGELSAAPVGRLVPTYQDDPDNYGCGVLSDGRVVTTDLGAKLEGDGSGQLIMWFPPFDSTDVSYCKLDVTLPTPGGIQVAPDDTVYVAAARPPGNGIVRFTGPFPTAADAGGGCGRTDGTGAPLVDRIEKTLFIPADEHAPTPNAVLLREDGSFYVSSAFTGTIAHYDEAGGFVDTIVAPPAGETFGATPFSTGSPFGMALDADGVLWFADLGLGIGEDGVGPVDGAGTVRRLEPGAGAAEIVDQGLAFPDGIVLYQP